MPSQQQLDNLHAAVPGAQASARKWGVPASVTLAQWIPESSWGMSELAVRAGNFFGVKATHLLNPETYIEMLTPEYVHGVRQMMLQKFQRYASVEESFDDHGRLLATAPRYKAAMASANLPEAFAVGLARGGYSTTPNYADQLIGFMRMYSLQQYDVKA